MGGQAKRKMYLEGGDSLGHGVGRAATPGTLAHFGGILLRENLPDGPLTGPLREKWSPQFRPPTSLQQANLAPGREPPP